MSVESKSLSIHAKHYMPSDDDIACVAIAMFGGHRPDGFVQRIERERREGKHLNRRAS